MEKHPIAVIDLGSNTFHILIAYIRDGIIEEIDRKRVFVGLGDGGIEFLKQSSIDKGLLALSEFKEMMARHGCENFTTIGTAALRSASNSQDFLIPAELILDQKIIIIDGDLEAKYIHKGVSLITDLSEGVSVIMDIGGGSTEFIVINNGQVIWSKSYKLGVGVLHAAFHHVEPIDETSIQNLKNHVHEMLFELKEELKPLNAVNKLVGASGSFEVLESMNGWEIATHSNHIVQIETCKNIIQKVVNADYEARLQMDGLPIERTKLIVVAMILIEVVLEILKPKYIEVCPYALKEGVLASTQKGL